MIQYAMLRETAKPLACRLNKLLRYTVPQALDPEVLFSVC